MKVIKPITIGTGQFVSSTAVETVALWNIATAYTTGNQVRVDGTTNKIYEAVQNSTGVDPTTDDDESHWIEVGPTLKWAMFDNEISTASTATSPLTVVVDIPLCNSLALLGLVGTQLAVTVTDGPAGPTIYSETFNLDGTVITDWYQYFFEPSVQMGEVTITDIPPYSGARATLSVTGTGTMEIGHFSAGTFYDLGGTRPGANAGIKDYSRKDTDAETGITTFVRRRFSKRMTAPLFVRTPQINKVQRVLADLRATPCVWIGSDDTIYSPLTMLGFYRDFRIDINGPVVSYCSLDIEGLA